jgi:hypothetical protein
MTAALALLAWLAVGLLVCLIFPPRSPQERARDEAP